MSRVTTAHTANLPQRFISQDLTQCPTSHVHKIASTPFHANMFYLLADINNVYLSVSINTILNDTHTELLPSPAGKEKKN